MSKTNWQDPKSTEIISPHISGLQEAIGKIEESIGIGTMVGTSIPLSEVFVSNDDRYRIFQAPLEKRNWLSSPTPVIKKNGIIISDDFIIEYGGGAVVFTNSIIGSDILTADATYTKKIEGKGLSQQMEQKADLDDTRKVLSEQLPDMDYAPTRHEHTKADITDFPTSMPANGGNADTVGGFTVSKSVPADAKFTDTVYVHPLTHHVGMIEGLSDSIIQKIENHAGVMAGGNRTGHTKIVNDLVESNSSVEALSAYQGYILNIEKSPINHTHTKADIKDFPASLPANGGNADTVSNKTANGTLKTTEKTNLVTAINQCFQFASDGKTAIATSIINKGVTASLEDPFSLLAARINAEMCKSGGTAAVTDVLSGKTFINNTGNVITGNMPNNGAIAQSITTQGGQYTIPTGYHNGSGTVTASFSNLIASNIKKGVNVGGIVGTLNAPLIRQETVRVDIPVAFVFTGTNGEPKSLTINLKSVSALSTYTKYQHINAFEIAGVKGSNDLPTLPQNYRITLSMSDADRQDGVIKCRYYAGIAANYKIDINFSIIYPVIGLSDNIGSYGEGIVN